MRFICNIKKKKKKKKTKIHPHKKKKKKKIKTRQRQGKGILIMYIKELLELDGDDILGHLERVFYTGSRGGDDFFL